MHIEESITQLQLENRKPTVSVSWNQQKCFTFQSHHSKFIARSISGLFLVFGCLILLCITLRTLKNEERSTNVIVSNLSGDKILFSTFYTDLFLLFGKKTGDGTGPPTPPLVTALFCFASTTPHISGARGNHVFRGCDTTCVEVSSCVSFERGFVFYFYRFFFFSEVSWAV